MATTAARATTTRTNVMEQFTWEGTDKRGVKMKGETTAKNASLLRAELRKQGINPTSVRTKAKPLFGKAGKSISAQDISVFSRQIATNVSIEPAMIASTSHHHLVRKRDALTIIWVNAGSSAPKPANTVSNCGTT